MIVQCGCGEKIQADSVRSLEATEDVSHIYYSRGKNGVFSVVGVKRAGKNKCGKCHEKEKEHAN